MVIEAHCLLTFTFTSDTKDVSVAGNMSIILCKFFNRRDWCDIESHL